MADGYSSSYGLCSTSFWAILFTERAKQAHLSNASSLKSVVGLLHMFNFQGGVQI